MPAAPGTKPLKPLHAGMGLYQVFHWPKKAPDKSKPWAVANLETGDVNGRWHATKEEALAQARALYARLGDKAKVHSEAVVHNAFFCFADSTLAAEDGVKWVEAIAPKTYTTPVYGEIVITPEKIDNFIHNFSNNVRGQEVAINYEHGIDPAKGNKAAGWIRGARKNARGNLELGIEYTEPAKQEILDKEWRYFSLEWDDEWLHPDGIIFKDVVMGGALTNRPVAKGLMPINFSEIFTEQADYEFAVWTTAYVNSLPDSCFLWIAPDGTRHLPYKDKSGKIDLPHLRNAAARVNQVKGMPTSTMNSIKNRIQKMLGGKGMSEIVDESKELEHSEPGTGSPPIPLTEGDGHDDADREGGWRRETPPIAVDPESVVDDEVVDDEEVVEPVVEPVVVTFSESEAIGYLTSAKAGLARIHTNAADAIIDKIDNILNQDFRTRSFNELQGLVTETRKMLRGDNSSDSSTPSPLKGGNTVGELTEKDLRELRNVLDVDDDGKIVEAVKVRFGELNALRDAVSASEQERIFAEQYPQYYSEHMRLMERDRRNTAKSFAESVQKVRKAEGYGLKDTRQGLSVATLEKVTDMHMKFAEGKATVEDFEEVVKAIVNGGIVQFGEIGSSAEDSIPEIDTSTATGVAGARRLFAEVVSKVLKDNPGMAYLDAVAEAGKKHPDLAESYKITLPA